jgi:hypothetical protein
VLHTVASFTDLTGLTPPLLIEVPLPNHEVIMYMCVGGYTFCIFLQWGIFYLFIFHCITVYLQDKAMNFTPSQINIQELLYIFVKNLNIPDWTCLHLRLSRLADHRH